MSYVEKLDAWYQAERAAGRIVDMKLFPGAVDQEVTAKAVLEAVTGVRESTVIDLRDLDRESSG